MDSFENYFKNIWCNFFLKKQNKQIGMRLKVSLSRPNPVFPLGVFPRNPAATKFLNNSPEMYLIKHAHTHILGCGAFIISDSCVCVHGFNVCAWV